MKWNQFPHEQKTVNAIKADFHTYLRKNSVYSACRMRPVRIMIVWKHCRSIAHSLQSVLAVMVAVRWQLYRMASSPSTFAPDSVDRYLPSRDTSTRPSAEKEKIPRRNIRISCAISDKLWGSYKSKYICIVYQKNNGRWRFIFSCDLILVALT